MPSLTAPLLLAVSAVTLSVILATRPSTNFSVTSKVHVHSKFVVVGESSEHAAELREEFGQTLRDPQAQASGRRPLNTATKEDLMQVENIGEDISEKIINSRGFLGGFRDWNEVEAIDGVGPVRVGKLQLSYFIRSCKEFRSMIISANMEMQELTPNRLLAMLFDALQPSVRLMRLWVNDQWNYDNPGNWALIAKGLEQLNVDAIVFACQECHDGDTPIQILHERLNNDISKFNNILEDEIWYETMTKAPHKSRMYIGLLEPNGSFIKTNCGGIVAGTTKEQQTAATGWKEMVMWKNKGAVIVHLTIPQESLSIAYVGAHLDTDKDARQENIRGIHEALDNTKISFAHTYLFGDLNYRLEANDTDLDALTSNCTACASEGKKWCYPPGELAASESICASTGWRGESCGDNNKISDAKHCTPEAIYEKYTRKMFQNHSTDGHLPNRMYDLLKDHDTLRATWKNGAGWHDRGYAMPAYTANTPPTYKRFYKTSSEIADCYDLQEKIEQGTHATQYRPNLTGVQNLSTSQELYDLSHRCYGHKEKYKSCELGNCLDYGWLDRLLIKGPMTSEDNDPGGDITKKLVLHHRTLKMFRDLGGGDHSPLYMLVDTCHSDDPDASCEYDRVRLESSEVPQGEGQEAE